MPIETLDDLIAEIADRIGVYGAHGEDDEKPCKPQCRICFESDIRLRIISAIDIERKLYPENFKGINQHG